MASWLSGGRRLGDGSSFVQSPSAPEVKGRLNFSSLDTPRLPGQMHRLSGDLPHALSPSGSSSRLGEYHRAKQNPAVLDQFYSPPTHSHLSQNLYKTSAATHSSSERFNVFPSRPSGSGSLLSPFRRTQTPLQSSLITGRLSDSRVSPFGTSLVSLAVRGRLRQSENRAVSPVIVQLSNPSDSSPNELSQRTQDQGENRVDPCNKDVVISALKQKRKRWACSADDTMATTDSQPAAKRSRHATEQQRSHSLPPSPVFARPSLHSRKREHTSTSSSLSSLSQALKKPRVFRPPSPVVPAATSSSGKMDTLPSTSALQMKSQDRTNLSDQNQDKRNESEILSHQLGRQQVTIPETGQPREQRVPTKLMSGSGSSRSLKLSVPDMEYESDSESVRCAPGGGGVKGDGVEESSVDSGRGSRGSTPPVQEEDDEEGREEEERARKNRAELLRLHKSLTSVFPSLHKTSSRRKVPVFCATGSAPLQPPALSTTHSVTQEDWRKDREEARAKLRDYLMAEENPPSKATDTPASPATATTTQPIPTTTQPALASADLQLPQPAVCTTSGLVTTANAALPVPTTSLTSSTVRPVTSVTGLTSSVTGSAGPSKLTVSQQAPKSVTFQLPNIATVSQSIPSLSTPATSQSAAVSQSGTGTGTGLVLDAGLQLGSLSTAKPATSSQTTSLITPSPSLPPIATSQPSTGATTGTLSLRGGFSLSGSASLKLPSVPTTNVSPATSVPQLLIPQQQQQQQQTQQQQQQQQQQIQRQTQQQQQQQTQPPNFGLSFPAGQSNTLLQTAATVTTSTQAAPTSNATPFSTLQLGGGLPLLGQQSSSMQASMSQSSQQSNPSNLFGPLGSGTASTVTSSSGSTANGFTLGGAGFRLPSSTTTATSSASSGFSFSSMGSSSGQVLSLQQPSTQNPSATLQNSSLGGLFKLDQTPKVAQPVTSTAAGTSGGLGFNFSGGSGLTFPSGGPTPQPSQQLQLTQQKSVLNFSGTTQQAQQAGGFSLGGPGGIIRAPSTSSGGTKATTFNFSASTQQSSTTIGGPQAPKLFGNNGLQQPPAPGNPSNPPAFNFGSPSVSQPSQAQAPKTTPFNFSAGLGSSSQQPQSGQIGGSLQLGGGNSGAGGGASMFNFSGAAGKTGNGTGTTSSSAGLQFGAPSVPQGGSNGGFNFSAGASSSGGLNFGKTLATPGNQMGTTPSAGVFGSSTNQMQGGMFGQTTPQQQSTTTGAGMFNPSLPMPSTMLHTTPQPQQQQPQLSGFNFTPQSSTNTFNFAASGGGGSFGTPGSTTGALFTAGTPQTNETSRPMATARRRRGRRK